MRDDIGSAIDNELQKAPPAEPDLQPVVAEGHRRKHRFALVSVVVSLVCVAALGVGYQFLDRGARALTPAGPASSAAPRERRFISKRAAIEVARSNDYLPGATVAGVRFSHYAPHGHATVPVWIVTFEGVQIPTSGPVPSNDHPPPPMRCWSSLGVVVAAKTGHWLSSGSSGHTTRCRFMRQAKGR